MLYVKCPATSANLGTGFDCLGVSFKLYNTFSFTLSARDNLLNFNDKYKYLKTNLVLKAYQSVFEYLQVEYKPVTIQMIKQEIPTARGLGSSASCIVAGVLSANYFLGNVLTQKQMLNLCVELEGHPDNVASCLLGGLVASFCDLEGVISVQYPISNNLHFYLLISKQESKTNAMRKILPPYYALSTIVYNSGRLVNLPYAFAQGNIELLRKVMADEIHEPYRLPLIASAMEIKEEIEKEAVVVISGAGSTLLAISDHVLNLTVDLSKYGFEIKEVEIEKQGANYYEE